MKTFKLENKPKIDTGFKTPDDYFENFSIKMMEQLPASKPKVISIFQKRKSLILMAVAILILALMIPILNDLSTTKKELDSIALENYVTYQSKYKSIRFDKCHGNQRHHKHEYQHCYRR